MKSGGGTALALALVGIAASGCHCGGQLQDVTGHLSITPDHLDFGAVATGQTGAGQLTLQNQGDVDLPLNAATFTGPNATDFSLATALPAAALKPGQSIQLQVSFAPGDAGPRQASLQISVGAPSTPDVAVPLSGTGIDVRICPQPSSVDFGAVQLRGSPVTRPLSLLNCGKTPAQVTLHGPQGPQSADFAVTGATTALLGVGQSLSVAVAFQPSGLGPESAQVPWQACDTCGPSSPVSLSGQGVDGALALTSANFGTVDIGQISTANVSATNTGTATILLTAISVRGPGSPFGWATAPSLPLAVAAGASTSLALQFSPSHGGPAQDYLDAVFTVADPTVAARTASALLTGSGWPTPCAISVAPSQLQFGNVQASPSPPPTLTVTVSNAGEAACSLSGISLGTGSDPSFAVVGPISLVVPASGSVGLTISFDPASAAPPLSKTGSLVFSSDDPAHPSVAVPVLGEVNPGVYSGGWPKWHFDNANSGRTVADTSHLTGAVAWHTAVGKPSSSVEAHLESPVVDAQGNVYFVSLTGVLFCFRPNGTLSWSTQLSDPSADPHPSTPVLLADGSLYVVSGQEQADPSQPNLYHLSAAGQILYSRNWGIEGFSATPGFGNDGTLFEADDDGIPGNGTDSSDLIAFQVQASGAVVAIAQAQVPFALPTSGDVIERLSVVLAADDTSYWCGGTQCFGMSPPPAFTASPSWPSGGVTFASPHGSLIDTGGGDVISDVAMDPVTGTLYAYAAWETSVDVYLAVQGVLAAIDTSSGAIRWTLPLPLTELPGNARQNLADYGNAAPAVASDGTVYVGAGDGLRAVNPTTGAVKWLFSTANVTDAPAIGGDGTIFFGARDGNFYAVTPAGNQRFSVHTGGQIASAPAIANDGTVYFVSDDGNLYALH